jgi:hypothetical protein
MNWLSPALAIWIGSIAIPSLLILYFLRLRRRDVEISTTLLWKKAIEDLQANAPFQKLRRNILLLLQLLILGAAVVAVGQPTLKAQTASGVRHLILIDRSASMSAKDATVNGQPATRLKSAKADAIKLIDSMHEPSLFNKDSGDQAMIIAFDSSAKALQTFTGDKNVLRAAVEAITQTDAPSSIDEAWRLAKAQAPRRFKIEKDETTGQEKTYELPSGPVGTVHLFTDGRLPDLAKATPTQEDVVLYHAQGKSDSSNIGITSLRAGRSFDNPSKLSIFVGLQTTDRQAREVEVELRIDDTPVAIKQVPMPAATITLPSGAAATTAAAAPAATGSSATLSPSSGRGQGEGSSSSPSSSTPTPAPTGTLSPALGGTVFSIDRPEGGIVSVHLRPPENDALATDNVGRLVVPPAKKLSVAIVTRGNLFIGAALESLPLSKLTTMSPEQYEQARAGGGGGGNKFDYDVTILDGYLPAVPKNSTSPLPAGRFLILNAVPAGLVEKDKPAPAEFLDWSRDHPVLRGVRLDPITIGKVHAIDIPKGLAATALATSSVGPAIIEYTTSEARTLVLPFDLAESNWPFDVSFVVFLAQAVGYLGDDAGGPGQSIQPGGVISDRLPPGASDVKVRLPDGAEADVGQPSPDGTVVYGPLEKSGVYQISWQGQAGPTDATVGSRHIRPFAVNLLDPSESDVGTAPTLEMATQKVAATHQEESKVSRPLWPWLLLGALVIAMLEWFVYNRKVHV